MGLMELKQATRSKKNKKKKIALTRRLINEPVGWI